MRELQFCTTKNVSPIRWTDSTVQGFSFLFIFYNRFKTMELALSTDEVSKEVRYILVVVSESCPKASLIVEIGMFLLLAMLAQACRALYNADIFVEIDAIKIIDNNEYQ